MKVYKKEDVDTHLRSADKNMKWMLVARITVIEANEKLKEVGGRPKEEVKETSQNYWADERIEESTRCTRCPEEGHLKKAERY